MLLKPFEAGLGSIYGEGEIVDLIKETSRLLGPREQALGPPGGLAQARCAFPEALASMGERLPAEGFGGPRGGIPKEGGEGRKNIRWGLPKRSDEGLEGVAIASHGDGAGEHGPFKPPFKKFLPSAGLKAHLGGCLRTEPGRQLKRTYAVRQRDRKSQGRHGAFKAEDRWRLRS